MCQMIYTKTSSQYCNACMYSFNRRRHQKNVKDFRDSRIKYVCTGSHTHPPTSSPILRSYPSYPITQNSYLESLNPNGFSASCFAPVAERAVSPTPPVVSLATLPTPFVASPRVPVVPLRVSPTTLPRPPTVCGFCGQKMRLWLR